MTISLSPGPESAVPLEARIQYLRRRRRPDLRTALAALGMVVAAGYVLLLGLGLFVH